MEPRVEPGQSNPTANWASRLLRVRKHAARPTVLVGEWLSLKENEWYSCPLLCSNALSSSGSIASPSKTFSVEKERSVILLSSFHRPLGLLMLVFLPSRAR